VLANGVTKYQSRQALVYFKPVRTFYATEHHPLICWEGSGYTFRHVQLQQLGNHVVYTGELQKGTDRLYTAWWMDNGRHRTVNQWDWRWRMLKGESHFRLINLTVARREELPMAVQATIMQQLEPNSFTRLPTPIRLSGASSR